MSPIAQTGAAWARTLRWEHALETKMTSNTMQHDQGKSAGANTEMSAPVEHEFSHSIDPDVEEAYWRENYIRRPYVAGGESFIEYRPAYRYGVDAHRRFDGRSFDDVAAELKRDWNRVKGTSSLTWEKAQLAARDAWERVRDMVERAMPGDSDRDGR
jgi:hypothetical protein